MLPRSWLPLAAVVALAGMVRCDHLGKLSYNFDEAFCAKMIGFPVGDIWGRCALDNHPPLYFYLLWGWARVFGDSPLALRSLSVVLGLATVVGAYLLVRQIARRGLRAKSGSGRPVSAASRPHPGPLPEGEGELAALTAAAMVALSPLQVDWSQHARMGYALGAALSVISCWLLLRALDAAAPRWRDWFWYALAATALAYTHHFALFVLAGQLLYWVACAVPRASWFISHRAGPLMAFGLIAIAYLPWAPNFLRQRERVSLSFHTSVFSWDEVAKACYQTLAVRWEDEPPSAALAWSATATCALPALAMLAWGRGGLSLVGLCVLVTFDAAICTSIADRNVIQSRYFVFANVLLLCGFPALVHQTLTGHGAAKRGNRSIAPRVLFGLLSHGAMAAMFVGVAWLCLEHAARRDRFAQRPGMTAAMAYLADACRPDEPVLVCTPLLQITAEACARGQPSETVQRVSATRRASKPILSSRVRVLSPHAAFPHFQGTAVMRAEDYLAPAELATSGASRLWAIDAVDWIAPEWKLNLPREWIEVSEAKFAEWAAAENCQIVVRCYEKGKTKNER